VAARAGPGPRSGRPPRPIVRAVNRSRVLRSLLGPGAFAGGALVAAPMEPGYRPRVVPAGRGHGRRG